MKPNAWIEISKSAVTHNATNIRSLLSQETKLMHVIKSDAYGIGIKNIAPLTENYVDWYGVNDLDEALEVRKLTSKNILILGYIDKKDIRSAIDNEFSFNLYNFEFIQTIKKVATSSNPAKIHINIDSGLSRLGIPRDKIFLFIQNLLNCSVIKLEGIYTHFSTISDTHGNPTYQKVLEDFLITTKKVKSDGVDLDLLHTASSGATFLYPDTHLDLVRVGIAMYGMWGYENYINLIEQMSDLKLIPAIALKSQVINLNIVKAGSGVGYGHNYTATDNTLIAVIGIGYADGLDRRFNSRGEVTINNQTAKIVGKIAMNTIMADVTHIQDIAIGDTVTIYSSNSSDIYKYVTCSQISTYEALNRLNPKLPRIITE